MAEKVRQAQDSFGFALYPSDGFAGVANVFSHSTEEFAKRATPSYQVILAHVMAHELGHLLLGVGSHSAAGIMHVPWTKKELERMAQGSMLFSSREADRIRQQIRARSAHEATDQARFSRNDDSRQK
jgi:hypothetical protein